MRSKNSVDAGGKVSELQVAISDETVEPASDNP
jgi:hypothetical protein